jgi:hypothetical protein
MSSRIGINTLRRSSSPGIPAHTLRALGYRGVWQCERSDVNVCATLDVYFPLIPSPGVQPTTSPMNRTSLHSMHDSTQHVGPYAVSAVKSAGK